MSIHYGVTYLTPWPSSCCLFLLSIHSFPVLHSFGARLLSIVLQTQQHLEINNSSIAPLLSSTLARSALSWPYGSVLSRARLLLRTLAPRKQRKGEGCCLSLSIPHIRLSLSLSLSLSLALSTLSPCLYLISFLSPSILERAYGFWSLSLSLSLVLFFMVVLWLTLRCVTVSGDCISLYAYIRYSPDKKYRAVESWVAEWYIPWDGRNLSTATDFARTLYWRGQDCIRLFSVHMRNCGIIQIYRVWRVPNK